MSTLTAEQRQLLNKLQARSGSELAVPLEQPYDFDEDQQEALQDQNGGYGTPGFPGQRELAMQRVLSQANQPKPSGAQSPQPDQDASQQVQSGPKIDPLTNTPIRQPRPEAGPQPDPRLGRLAPNENLNKNVQFDKSNNQSRTAIPYTVDQIQAMTSLANQSPGVQDQRAGLQQLQSQLDRYRSQPIAPNFAMNYAHIDSNYGTNLLKGYSPPENSDDKFKNVMAYQEKIQQERKDLADQIQKYIRREEGPSFITTGNNNGTSNENTDGTKALRPFGMGAGRGAKGYDDSKDVVALANKLKPLAGTQQSLAEVAQAFKDATGQDLDTWQGQNIPGEGLGGGMLPNWALGMTNPKAAALRQAVNAFRNDQLEGEFGKRLTATEKQTLGDMLGNSKMTTDGNLVQGIKLARSKLQAMIQAEEAGYQGTHPQVISDYRKGVGALNSDYAGQIGHGSGQPAPGPGAGGAPAAAPTQKQQRLNQIDQHLNDIGAMLKSFQAPQKGQ